MSSGEMELMVDSGQLPVGWNIKYLDELCENLDSKRIPITKSSRKSGNIPYYGASGIVDYVADYIFNEDLLLVSEDGANLLARTYPIAFSITGKTWVNNHAHVLRFKEKITQSFIEYYLNSISLESYVSGMAQPKLNQKSLNSIAIPIPPLPEQKRIVAIADEAFEGIDRAIRNTEKNLSNARELFESYLNSIFTQKGDGWEEKKLGDVCQVKDGTHFSPKNSEDGKYMYITAKNIKPYYIDLTKITFISEEDHQKIYSRCPVKKGDVLYIKDGATAGIAAINNFEEEFSLLSSVAVFKTSSQILNTYLVHYANSNLGRKNFLGYIDGAAITRLTLTKLNNVFIPIAPLYAQQEIVTKLDELSAETQRLENIYRQKIAALKELKQSILQKAFTGELTADKGEK
ncbi:restriction endonuclease subunit S [Dolichospermum sp. UHCC 0684]|jgi:type I restriction enzyme, S subunit|uniref:restriction endonuclease subunit S n=1 Tax=unclassified Dolichospermum TaxID=2622029 RepID=UPI0020C1C64B|nr:MULTISPECIES: restriction endonuclease subunit S [unclassified Dolichospermum]MEA5529941.1 restriction endonuclease subunit S [Dolichospermum sp. UHCC 0684]